MRMDKEIFGSKEEVARLNETAQGTLWYLSN